MTRPPSESAKRRAYPKTIADGERPRENSSQNWDDEFDEDEFDDMDGPDEFDVGEDFVEPTPAGGLDSFDEDFTVTESFPRPESDEFADEFADLDDV